MAIALRKGLRVLGRPLADMERLALCLLRVPPTNRIDLSVQHKSASGVGAQWNHFLRVFNAKASDSPMIYVAIQAQSLRGNPHVHALLWTYPHAATAHGAARKSGFGKPSLTSLKDRDLQGRLRDLSYVLGQHEPVFGGKAHLGNEPLAPGQHALLKNQGRTIESRKPELFHALQDWESQSVSDQMLMDRIPRSRLE